MIATSPLALHQAQLVRQWSDQVVLFTGPLGALDTKIESRLRSRGIEVITSEVVEVLGEDDRLAGVRTKDGKIISIDAIFTAGVARPQDEFLTHLGLERTDNPMGNFLSVDDTGKTSSDRIWAVGNVTMAGANVPMSISAGAVAGGMVNMALITAEFDAAEAAATAEQETSLEGGAA